MSPADAFADLVAALGGEPGVSVPDPGARRTFGSTALRVDGRIFAMLSRGHVVLKLPADRVAGLVACGAGRPFTQRPGATTGWREWVEVVDLAAADELGREALAYGRTVG